MAGIVGNSQYPNDLQQENEILKAELKETKTQVIKLQEQLRGSVLVYVISTFCIVTYVRVI